MAGKRLFIFLEGSDDVRFFETIIRPRFLHSYESVELVTYACTKSVRVDRFIRGINSLHHDYIIVADIDQERSVAAKKGVVMSRFSEADFNRVMVIIMEIESWYLAGLDKNSEHLLGIRDHPTTDYVTKELFNRWIPRNYQSRIAFMVAILKYFSLSAASGKNKSFRYFIEHFLIANPGDANAGTSPFEKGVPGTEADSDDPMAERVHEAHSQNPENGSQESPGDRDS